MSDAPIDFLMALSQNAGAMQRFSALSEMEQQRIIDQARSIQSRPEMQALVDNIRA